MCSRSNHSMQYSIASYEPIPYDEKGVIYWTYINLCRDIGEVEQVDIINSASKIMDHELYPLRHKYSKSLDEAYFKFCFVDETGYATGQDPSIKIKSPFDFSDPLNKDVIAVFYPKYDGQYSGWGFFNDQMFFSLVDDGQGVLLINSIVHEWLHGFGIGHTKNKADIMYYKYGVDRRITDDSRDAMDELYLDYRIRMLMKVSGSRRLVKELKRRAIISDGSACDVIKTLIRLQ